MGCLEVLTLSSSVLIFMLYARQRTGLVNDYVIEEIFVSIRRNLHVISVAKLLSLSIVLLTSASHVCFSTVQSQSCYPYMVITERGTPVIHIIYRIICIFFSVKMIEF